MPADDRPDSRTNERSSAFDYSRGAPHPTPSSPTEPFIFAIAAPPLAAPIPTTSTRRNGSSRRRPRSRPPRVAEETRILSDRLPESRDSEVVEPSIHARSGRLRLVRARRRRGPLGDGGVASVAVADARALAVLTRFRREPARGVGSPSRSSGGRLRTSPSSSIPVSLGFRARDDAEAAYVARIRGARSNPGPRWGGGGSDRTFQAQARVGGGRRCRRLLARGDGEATAARLARGGWRRSRGREGAGGARRRRRRRRRAQGGGADGGGAIAAEDERGGQSGGAAWQPTRPVPPSLYRRAGRTSASVKDFSMGRVGKGGGQASKGVGCARARRGAGDARGAHRERERDDERVRQTNPFAVRHPTNASPARLAAHGRHLHARGEQRRARIERAHAAASVTQLASPPVGMGGEESVAFRGMTNVSRALMEDRAHEDFLQRHLSVEKAGRQDGGDASRQRGGGVKERGGRDASTPVITKTASAMRRSVDDLRAWQDRKNASVRELRRRRDEYEDRVHNTFAPRMSKVPSPSNASEETRRSASIVPRDSPGTHR